jgi:hypothetical protein
MGIYAPRGHTPPVPMPVAAYDTPTGATIDPFRGSLRVVMIVWGALMLLALATPLSTDPLMFHWDSVLEHPNTAAIVTMMHGAIGLLGVLLALIPLATLPRGIFAALLGLAGIVVPIVLRGEVPAWGTILVYVAWLFLVTGLLMRNEYPDSMTARILVTIGVACALVPYLVPTSLGEIPLIGLFRQVITADGLAKVPAMLELGLLLVILMSLLAWMPGPATAGAKVFAWVILVWVALMTYTFLLIDGHVVDKIKSMPFETLVKWLPPTVCEVFAGYGLATVIGKQLE